MLFMGKSDLIQAEKIALTSLLSLDWRGLREIQNIWWDGNGPDVGIWKLSATAEAWGET